MRNVVVNTLQGIELLGSGRFKDQAPANWQAMGPDAEEAGQQAQKLLDESEQAAFAAERRRREEAMTPRVRDIAEARRGHWERVQSTVDALAGHGMQEYVNSLPSSEGAFRLRDLVVRCIDGRVEGGLRLAGSGIGIGLEKARRFAEVGGATGISYHRDCGAAALWAREQGLPVEEATQYAREFADKLAGELGVSCSEAWLEGEEGFHDELVVYYDGTGSFDPSRVRFLPRGFVINRRLLDFDAPYALQQVEIAVGIALGEHGFAELFTPDTPLRLVPIGADEQQVQHLAAELQPWEAAHKGRVVVDGLVAPGAS